MTRAMKKVVHEGRLWCPVEDAARHLHTNTNKIRVYMGSGALACTQIRKNGRIYVSVQDLVKLTVTKVKP